MNKEFMLNQHFFNRIKPIAFLIYSSNIDDVQNEEEEEVEDVNEKRFEDLNVKIDGLEKKLDKDHKT